LTLINDLLLDLFPFLFFVSASSEVFSCEQPSLGHMLETSKHGVEHEAAEPIPINSCKIKASSACK